MIVTKAVFFHIPKCGGTFLNHYFNDCVEQENKDNIKIIERVGHSRYIDIKNTISSLFKFSFIRNPFAFHVSRYFYYLQDIQSSANEIMNGCDFNLRGYDFANRFPTFKTYILCGFDKLNNFSLTSIYKEMLFENNINKMDFVGKMEDYTIHIPYILERIDVQPRNHITKFIFDNFNNIKKRNSSKHKIYYDYYDNELIDLIYKQEKYIIQNFNYDIGNHCKNDRVKYIV